MGSQWTWWEMEHRGQCRGVLEYQDPSHEDRALQLVVRTLSDGSTLGIWLVAESGDPLAVVRAAGC